MAETVDVLHESLLLPTEKEGKMNKACAVDEQVDYNKKQELILSVGKMVLSFGVLTCQLFFNVCYRRPDDWTLLWWQWNTIYGWGHNHRGQLGALKVQKLKSPCEALAALRPVQLIGGNRRSSR